MNFISKNVKSALQVLVARFCAGSFSLPKTTMQRGHAKNSLAHFLMLVCLLGASAPGQSHPMPSSSVLLHLRNTSIDVQLDLPIIELKLGWQKPLQLDAVATVRDYGTELKSYVLQHIHPVAPDGRRLESDD